MPTAWWRDQSVILFDTDYKPNIQRTANLRNNVKIIGIFFGSFRNRSSKQFVKYLQKFYTYAHQQNKGFEVIYLPMDEDEPDAEFFVKAVMFDWLSVPWGNQALRRNVRNTYNVLEQPWLVVVKNDLSGQLISFNGKADLLDYGYFCIKEWEQIAKTIPEEEEKVQEVRGPDKDKRKTRTKIPFQISSKSKKLN